MNKNERVKELRKSLGLTMEKFGERLGVTKMTISRIESGVNNVTDQMFKSICREFNVNEEWLRTGEGEMFNNTQDSYVELIERIMSSENDFAKNIFKSFAQFSDSDWKALQRMIEMCQSISVNDNSVGNDITDIYNELPDTAEEFEQQYPVIDDDSKNAG